LSATNQLRAAASASPTRFSSLAILACSVAVGFSILAFVDAPRDILFAALGAGVLLLLLYPELALALYVVIGDLKGDDRIGSLLPFDLTLALGAVLLAGIVFNFLRGKSVLRMPAIHLLFLAFVAWMTVSLSYTPVFDAGLEKLGRFVSVTAVVIIAPFFVLATSSSIKRFFVGFGLASFSICAWSLFALGGSVRLATPSDNTIGLGHIACALILMIWFGVIPRYAFPKRLLVYALLAIPGIALIGSGARGPAMACAAVILASLLFSRARWLDVGCLALLGIVTLPFLRVPASSLDYLGTMFRSHSPAELLDFRGDLLASAWQLLQKHPLIGGGIQSFRYYSPNPGVYNWPHNIFLEIACELGIPAALMACAIFASAIRESFRQLKNRAISNAALSRLTAALLAVGIINGTNTGDINSDRLTWLFVSLVFVVGNLQLQQRELSLPLATAPLAVEA